MKDIIALLKVVINFLSTLSEEQVRGLIDKKIKLKIDSQHSVEKVPVVGENVTGIGVDEICAKLDALATREQAYDYFDKLNDIGKATLKEIAKHYDIPFHSKDTNARLIEMIIENVIGSKLRSDAIFSTNLK